jgi:hypothetical protein
MSASAIVQQWSTYPAFDWLSFSAVILIGTWIGGCGGTVIAHFITCVLVYLSDAKQIMSQPEGDLDIVFWMGFFPRMISINLLLTCVLALPTILARKPILRFDSWTAGFWSWRLRPIPVISMTTETRS